MEVVFRVPEAEFDSQDLRPPLFLATFASAAFYVEEESGGVGSDAVFSIF